MTRESWVEAVVEEPERLVIKYGPAKTLTLWIHGPWRLWSWITGDDSYWLNVYRPGLVDPIVRERHRNERDVIEAACRWATMGIGSQRWPCVTRSPIR